MNVRLLTALGKLEQRRFWATHVNLRLDMFPLLIYYWCQKISPAKFLYHMTETICPKICSNLRLKFGKRPLPVDTWHPKMSLVELPIPKASGQLEDKICHRFFIISCRERHKLNALMTPRQNDVNPIQTWGFSLLTRKLNNSKTFHTVFTNLNDFS